MTAGTDSSEAPEELVRLAESCRTEERIEVVQSVVGVALIRDGLVLAAYRPGPDGGWEFPGGKVEAGETDEQAAVRELREELAVEITVGPSLGPGVDISPEYRLHVYSATIVAGDPILREHSDLRWFAPGDLDDNDWLVPDRPFVRALRQTT